MKNGRPSTQLMAKASGGGTDTPMIGFLNRNLETGPCSSIQKELPNGVILMDAVSMPSRTHGEPMKTMKMAGRPLTTQMGGAHGGGTNTQKIGSLSQNLGTGWQQPIPGTIKLSGSTRMDATSVPQLNPGSSMNKAMILTNSFNWIELFMSTLRNFIYQLMVPLVFYTNQLYGIDLVTGPGRDAQVVFADIIMYFEGI